MGFPETGSGLVGAPLAYEYRLMDKKLFTFSLLAIGRGIKNG
jgi:hypothetical protein